MKREMLTDVARMKLNEARECRRLAIKHRLDGNVALSDLYRKRAAMHIKLAKLFFHDAHTEELSTVHLKGRS